MAGNFYENRSLNDSKMTIASSINEKTTSSTSSFSASSNSSMSNSFYSYSKSSQINYNKIESNHIDLDTNTRSECSLENCSSCRQGFAHEIYLPNTLGMNHNPTSYEYSSYRQEYQESYKDSSSHNQNYQQEYQSLMHAAHNRRELDDTSRYGFHAENFPGNHMESTSAYHQINSTSCMNSLPSASVTNNDLITTVQSSADPCQNQHNTDLYHHFNAQSSFKQETLNNNIQFLQQPFLLI
jgi:hypothetical protein